MSDDGFLSPRETATRAAEDHWGTPTQRHVTITLARLVKDESFEVHPSVAFLVYRTGYSHGTIEATIKTLREYGVLRLVATEGRGGSHVYIFDHERLQEVHAAREPWKEVRERLLQEQAQRSPMVRKSRRAISQQLGSVTNANDIDAPQSVRPRSPINAATLPNPGIDAPQSAARTSPVVGDKGLRGLTEGYKTEGIIGADIASQRSADITGSGVAGAAQTPMPKQATVADLVAAFKALCDQGLCTWTANHVQRSRMCHDFARLIRERGATADMVREALPIAQKRVAKTRRPSGASITSAMFRMTQECFGDVTREDNEDFFDRPAAAGICMLGNDTRH
ncbi:hypothetical protein AB4Y40_16215 [Paraburkholderia sp. EG287B]|uniref:hypothetical protein n=1 Tax=Paraburkholderia sp. EG287B TaxID=3237010 RepID=UPI0034D38638